MEYNPFAFFTFYYNAIKKSDKKYDIALNPKNFIAVAVTPVILYVIISAILFIFLPDIYILSIAFIPVAVFNILFLNHVSAEGRQLRFEREYERKRQEAERDAEERVRRSREAWDRILKELIEREKRYNEQQRQREQEFKNRYYQNSYGKSRDYDWYYNFNEKKYHYNQSKKQPMSDKNRENAMSLLGLSEGFTQDDVKKAYRRLSKKHHPDMGGTEENFIRLNKAYKYLMK